MNRLRPIRLPENGESEPPLMLTPLIDMVFLVLIFFVINSAISMEPAVEVQLPESETAQTQRDDLVLVVTLTRDGVMYLGDQEVSAAGFPEALRRRAEEAGSETVLTLRADRGVPYGEIMDVMDTARSLGLTQISLVTEDNL